MLALKEEFVSFGALHLSRGQMEVIQWPLFFHGCLRRKKSSAELDGPGVAPGGGVNLYCS